MLLALEYVLRTGTLKSCLQFPASIFIEHKRWDDKIVITIHKKNNGYCVVKHWFVSRCRSQFLPSFVEFVIPDNNIFVNERVILPNYYILKFTPNPYLYDRKQYAEVPRCLTQEQEYNRYINTFYNSETHRLKRINWLWEAFRNMHKDEIKSYDGNYSYPYFGYSSISDLLDNQRNKVQEHSKKLWSNWNIWRKYLLDFQYSVSPELIFEQDYHEQNIREDLENANRLNYLMLEPSQQ